MGIVGSASSRAERFFSRSAHVPGLVYLRQRSARRSQGRPAFHHYPRALPQGDGGAGPAFARGAVRCECNLVVLDTRDVLHDPFTVRCPSIDAEGEVSSRRGHLLWPVCQ